jgi:hypothetical protein
MAGTYSRVANPRKSPILKIAITGAGLLYKATILYQHQIMIELISRGAEKCPQSGRREVIRI